MSKPTGEDVAALLSGIHTHAELIHDNVEDARKKLRRELVNGVESRIFYAEEDLLPILKALGLPEPVWGGSMSVKEYEKKKLTKLPGVDNEHVIPSSPIIRKENRKV